MSTPSAQHQEINSICPYCNCKLEEGYIITNGRRLMFSQKKWKLIYDTDNDEIMLDANMFAACHKAYVCRNCKKIIVDY